MLKKNCHKVVSYAQLLRTLAAGLKYIFFFWGFLPTIFVCLLSWCDLFNMSSFYQISLTVSFDILCSDPLNLKIKDAKGEHKKIFCGRVRSPRPAPPFCLLTTWTYGWSLLSKTLAFWNRWIFSNITEIFALKNCLIFCQVNNFCMFKFVREKWIYCLPKGFIACYKVNI